MEINQDKLNRQLIGVDRWVHSKDYGAYSNGIGCLWWFTGVGKTFAAMIVLNRLFQHNPSSRVIVIVPSEQLTKDWRNEIRNHIPPEFWAHIEVYTINYLVENNYSVSCDLLICDEIHEYLTPERIKYLDKTKIQYKFMLGLTATWEDKHNRQRQLYHICPVIDEIDEREALDRGFISKYIEYNLACKLSPDEELGYREYTRQIGVLLPKFGKSLELAQKCLSGGTHEDGRSYSGFQFSSGWAMKNGWYPGGNVDDDEYYKLNDLWNPHKVIGYAKNLMFAIRERKEILYNANDKAIKAAEIVEHFDTLKAICFSQSTAFADKLALIINMKVPNSCVAYHSKLETISKFNEVTNKIEKFGKTKLRKQAIEAIRSGTARIISTASALDKGFNVEDIRLAITTSGTTNPTQHKQRKGRAVRLEIYAPDTTVLIINTYIPDTQDERWLRSRQRKAANIIYWVKEVSEITYSPVDKTTFDLLDLQ